MLTQSLLLMGNAKCTSHSFGECVQKKREFAGDNLTISWLFEANDIHLKSSETVI